MVTTGFADPPCPARVVVPALVTAVPTMHRPLGGRSAGKRLTGRRQARLWLPTPTLLWSGEQLGAARAVRK